MVTGQASLKRNGVQDFVTIRATALIMTAFALFMGWFLSARLKSPLSFGKIYFLA